MAGKQTANTQREELKQEFVGNLQLKCSVSPDEASDKQIYQVLSAMMLKRLKRKRQQFINRVYSIGKKQVYYLSMEFLMGRSLKTILYNLELQDDVESILGDYHIKLENIFECEPDAGLGNGGLGRLAACYLDAMATQSLCHNRVVGISEYIGDDMPSQFPRIAAVIQQYTHQFWNRQSRVGVVDVDGNFFVEIFQRAIDVHMVVDNIANSRRT